jgi:hypothetical protein
MRSITPVAEIYVPYTLGATTQGGLPRPAPTPTTELTHPPAPL